MKMYVFTGANAGKSLEAERTQPFLSHAVDATLVRLGAFLLAWTAGAGAAAFVAF